MRSPRMHDLLPRTRPTAPVRTTAVRTTAALALALLASACGGGLTGRYANAGGVGSLDFRSNGTVYVTLYGGTFAGTYEVEGERVIVRGPGGAQVFVKTGDRLDGDYGMTFVKQARELRQGE